MCFVNEQRNQPFNPASNATQVAVWSVQIILTVVFGIAGWMHLFFPLPALAAYIPWLAEMPEVWVRLIGVVEILGALGLFFPSVLQRKPGLSILAAGALTMAMFIAASMHYMHGEYTAMLIPAALAALSGYVALMRMTRAQMRVRGK